MNSEKKRSCTPERLMALGLAIGMIATGTMNTLMTKLQDNVNLDMDYNDNSSCTANCTAATEGFNHPAFQTWTMFVGEFLCLFAFKASVWSHRSKVREGKIDPTIPGNEEPKINGPWYIFLLPTLCDITGTTLMNVGLNYTNASVYQMLRGASVLFTALLSVIFLRRRLKAFHAFGIFLIIGGIALVGLASILFSNDTSGNSNPALGDILVILAQVVVAIQFVVEEKFIGKYNVPPLAAVGSEGFWGFLILSIALPCMHFIHIDGKPIENMNDVWFFVRNSSTLVLAICGSILSIAFFNFFGVSVTKYMSATHRSTIDCCRTLFITIFTIIFGWEEFLWLQFVGFAILVLGTFVYNEVIPVRHLTIWRKMCCFMPESCFSEDAEESEKTRLINEDRNEVSSLAHFAANRHDSAVSGLSKSSF